MGNRAQVTYDREVEMGYIYFCEPSLYKVTSTEELPVNDDIMLDFGEGIPIVGIELGGDTARKVETLADKGHIFKKEVTGDGKTYYTFRLSDERPRKSIFHPEVDSIVFHFSDTTCEDFIGIDIFDSDSYSELDLTDQI
ncbi:DUF2283 domain-containing protein [Peribacillus sp. NPDC097675]|uniref:DUF2283 domain-containing protein n=1 Tax=Peribacillus sp. NPDC097675 TaxID=3390618 RepID=UPI003CFD921F